MSEINGLVSKVQCRTCGSVHKYRNGEKKASKPKGEPTARTVTAKSSEIQILWQKKKSAMLATADIVDYRVGGDYGTSVIVRHATFGLGFVERVLSKTRVEILFESGLKVMVMNTGRENGEGA